MDGGNADEQCRSRDEKLSLLDVLPLIGVFDRTRDERLD
jgi:hypothetical protein